MRLALALLVLGSLAGCSTKYDLTGADWKKPGARLPVTTLDELDCVRAAREAGRTPELAVGGLADLTRFAIEEGQRTGSFRQCMTAKGYTPSGS